MATDLIALASPDELAEAEYRARFVNDPVFFGEEVLGLKAPPGFPEWATDDQRRICDAVVHHHRVAVHAGHNVGKTFIAGVLAVWFLNTRRPAKVVTTAPTWRQVERLLWSEIRTHYKRVPHLEGRILPQKPVINVAPNHFALGFSTDDLDSFSGYHSENLLIILDEAAGVDPDIWVACEGIASDDNAIILAIGNPGEPSGPFYDACQSSVFRAIHMSCRNHPNVVQDRAVFPGMVSRRWIRDRESAWGKDSALFKARVEGLFPEEGINTVIPLSAVEICMGQHSSFDPGHPIVISCDVAREGDDETVIMVLEDDKVTEVIAYSGRNLMETVGRIVQVRRGFDRYDPVIIVVDDIGVGGGVTDRLRELNGEEGTEGLFAVHGFKGSLAPKYKGPGVQRIDKRRERFKNRRAQAWWELREGMMAERLALPTDDRLKNQLSAPLYEIKSDGLVHVESKKDMKKRLGEHDPVGKSPDRADALVMAWWARNHSPPPAPPRKKARPKPKQTFKPDFAEASSAPASDPW